MKYMIVDDNADMRTMIRSVLCGTRDIVTECSDGDEAVLQYPGSHPDVVLMDLTMKRMSGLEATKKIHDADPNANIIIVTNINSKAMQSAAVSVGASAFFSKDDLMVVKKFLKERKRH